MEMSSGERQETVEMTRILEGEGLNYWAESEEMNEAGMDVNAGGAPDNDVGDHPCYGVYQGGSGMIGLPMDTSEVIGETSREGELEKREGWPIWLRSAVDMLHEGERGRQLTPILVNFIKLEKALGFKGEKTVFIISIGKERLLTMMYTG
jgi:hypothetical protein